MLAKRSLIITSNSYAHTKGTYKNLFPYKVCKVKLSECSFSKIHGIKPTISREIGDILTSNRRILKQYIGDEDVSYPRASQPRSHGQRRTGKDRGNEVACNKRNESGLLAGFSV